MEITVERQKEARRFCVDVQQMAYADLVAAGWDEQDAFVTVFNAVHWDQGLVKRKVKATSALDGVKKRIKFTKGKLSQDAFTGKIDLSKASKEQILKELLEAKEGLEPGTKEWLDINKQIIEVNQLKKDEVKTEDTTVHFYEPLKCHMCELRARYSREKESKAQEDDTEPDDDTEISEE